MAAEARYAAARMGNPEYHDFITTEADIFNIDLWRRSRGARASALFILSFVPIVGTLVDIIEAFQTIADLKDGKISGQEVAFYLTLSLIGPLGDSARAIRLLADSGGGVAYTVRSAYRSSIDSNDIYQAIVALDDDIIGQMQRNTDVLDEITYELNQILIHLDWPQAHDRPAPVSTGQLISTNIAVELGFDTLRGFEQNVARRPFTIPVTIPEELKLRWYQALLARIRGEHNIGLYAGQTINLPVELGGRFNIDGSLIDTIIGSTFFKNENGRWEFAAQVSLASIRYDFSDFIDSHYHPNNLSFSMSDFAHTINNVPRGLQELRAFGRSNLYQLIPTSETIQSLRDIHEKTLNRIIWSLTHNNYDEIRVGGTKINHIFDLNRFPPGQYQITIDITYTSIPEIGPESISLSFDKNGVLQVKAPKFMMPGQINNFLLKNSTWIDENFHKIHERIQNKKYYLL